MDVHQLIRIFVEMDEFCKELDNYCKHYMLTGPAPGKRGRACGLAISEIMNYFGDVS